MKTKLVYKSHPFKMKQMKKNGFNSLKPVCYKNAQDFITGPPFLSGTNSSQAYSESEQVLQLLGIS